MYLRHHHVRNVKLLRDVEVDFCRPDGTPRMWTVFVGENRLCKTTLLQSFLSELDDLAWDNYFIKTII